MLRERRQHQWMQKTWPGRITKRKMQRALDKTQTAKGPWHSKERDGLLFFDSSCLQGNLALCFSCK